MSEPTKEASETFDSASFAFSENPSLLISSGVISSLNSRLSLGACEKTKTVAQRYNGCTTTGWYTVAPFHPTCKVRLGNVRTSSVRTLFSLQALQEFFLERLACPHVSSYSGSTECVIQFYLAFSAMVEREAAFVRRFRCLKATRRSRHRRRRRSCCAVFEAETQATQKVLRVPPRIEVR